MNSTEISSMNADHRVGILIDGNNINRGVKSETQQINYDTMIERILHGRQLKKLFYFQEGDINQAFAFALHQKFHGSVRSCKKSADVPLAVQAIQLAPHVDTLILGSGDIDYKDLVTYLRAQGVTVEILSFKSSLSYEMEHLADFVHFVKDVDLMKKSVGTATSPEKVKQVQAQPVQKSVQPPKPTVKKKGKSTAIIASVLSFAPETPEPIEQPINPPVKKARKKSQKKNAKSRSNIVSQNPNKISNPVDPGVPGINSVSDNSGI